MKKLNVIIPMAGRGKRFEGYNDPKPFIKFKGKTMIEWAIETLGIDAPHIFLMLKSHAEYAPIVKNLMKEGSTILWIGEVTQGPACTALLAEKLINNNIPLLSANCDQYLEWDAQRFLKDMEGADGGLGTYTDSSPDGAFVTLGADGYVDKVAEKEVISDIAQTGIYYWKKGSDFVKYARQMIDEEVRVNGEYYISPIYNWAIKDGKKIKISQLGPNERIWRTGIPRELKKFLEERP